MNNPDLINALCEQIKTETESLQKSTWNVRNTITDDTRELFISMQITNVLHLQQLVMALTQEMTPEEKKEYQEQVEESEPGGEE